MKINYQSDFKLYEQCEADDLTAPFRFEYRTSGLTTYTAEFDGENYKSCRRLDDGSLLVAFDNHKLSTGTLQVRREYFLSDSDFADGVHNRVTVEQTEIILTTGASEENSAIVEIIPPYIKGKDGYTPVKGVDYYTDDEKEEIIDELEQHMEDFTNRFNVVQEVGDSTTNVMSQFAVTEAIAKRDYSELEEFLAYGIEFDTTVSSPTCTRIGSSSLHRTLPIHSKMLGCLLADDGTVAEYLPAGDWSGATRDGSSGQVMVEIPAHYCKFTTSGTKRQVWLSEYPITGYHLVPKFYISAYEAGIQRSTTTLCSVVNDSVDYRGGDNNYTYDGSSCSLLGCPVSEMTLSEFRAAARKRNNSQTSEWNCYTYEAWKTLYWLFVVEFATLNSQAPINYELTSEGYRQGGLGDGPTTLYTSDLEYFNNSNPIIPCGYTDSLGNGTGQIDFVTVDPSYEDYPLILHTNRYRGVENPFGHIAKLIDGILLDTAYSHGGGNSEYLNHALVYIARDPEDFASYDTHSGSEYEGYEMVGLMPQSAAFIKRSSSESMAIL